MTAQDIKQDFERALVKHLLFKSNLRSFLYGTNTAEAPIRDPEVCALGQWIRERRTGAYAHLKEEMRLLDHHHRRLHEAANHLMDLHLAGKAEAALTGLTDLQPLINRIANQLTTLREQVQAEPPA